MALRVVFADDNFLVREGVSALMAEVPDDVAARRFNERIEVAAYFCATQAVADAAAPSHVRVDTEGDWLRIDDQTWTASHAEMVVRLPMVDQLSTTAPAQT